MPRTLESKEISIVQGPFEFKFGHKLMEYEEMVNHILGGRVATGKTYTQESSNLVFSYDGIVILNITPYDSDTQRIKSVILKEEAKKITTDLIEGTKNQDGGEGESNTRIES